MTPDKLILSSIATSLLLKRMQDVEKEKDDLVNEMASAYCRNRHRNITACLPGQTTDGHRNSFTGNFTGLQ